MMQNISLQQSPRLAKISNSTQQFRQLINDLRKNQRNPKPQPEKPQSKLQQIQPKELKQNKSEGVQCRIQNKQLPSIKSVSVLNVIEEDDGLRFIPRMDIGGRDSLRKRRFEVDNNPQFIAIKGSKEIKKEKVVELAQLQNNFVDRKAEVSRINVSTQYQSENRESIINNIHFQSNFSIISPQKLQKVGQIIRQHVKPETTHSQSKSSKRIKDIDEKIIIDYYERQNKLHEKSQPNSIFSFFTNLCFSCDIYIKSPSIKKYKNCIYFGFPIQKEQNYEGFLYFYEQKFYYGELLNGFKHGLGVQLNFLQAVKYKGEFKEGHKTGKFFVEKQNEKYIGYLQNGLYEGEGRLVTNDYTYEGFFDRGQKNGYGEEFYPKTGIKISGNFRNGILEKTKISKSIPEIQSKTKIVLSKDKSSAKLEHIRKKSLEKHTQRMSKLNKTSRSSEYEMQFDTQEEYNQPPKIQFNASKLEMYRQPIPKLSNLPKICQELNYSFDSAHNMQSINTNYANNLQVKMNHERRGFVNQRTNNNRIANERSKSNRVNANERSTTNQFEQPLPYPCLAMIKRR